MFPVELFHVVYSTQFDSLSIWLMKLFRYSVRLSARSFAVCVCIRFCAVSNRS